MRRRNDGRDEQRVIVMTRRKLAGVAVVAGVAVLLVRFAAVAGEIAVGLALTCLVLAPFYGRPR